MPFSRIYVRYEIIVPRNILLWAANDQFSLMATLYLTVRGGGGGTLYNSSQTHKEAVGQQKLKNWLQNIIYF